MRRRLTRALGALALGCLAGPALAADPAIGGTDPTPAAVLPQPTVRAQDPAAPVLGPGAVTGADAASGWGQFFGGAGVYIMKPFLEKDRAWVKTVGLGSPPSQGSAADFLNQQATDFTYDFQAAPRFWLGWVSDSGWGARARYFHFDADGKAPPGTLGAGEGPGAATALHPADPLTNRALDVETNFVLPPPVGLGVGTDVLTVSSRLQMDVWDLEGIDEIRTGSWLFTLSGGVRHADVVQFYDAVRQNTADTGGTDVRTLRSAARFTGAGPLFGLDVRRALGDTGLAVYGNARGGVIFADRRAIAYATQAGGFTLADNMQKRDDSVPVSEAEVGVEWSATIGGLRPFVQAGVIGQGWFNALTNDAAGTEPPPAVYTGTNGMLGLFGVNITAGVSF